MKKEIDHLDILEDLYLQYGDMKIAMLKYLDLYGYEIRKKACSKYYELQTTSNMNRSSIYHNVFITEEQLHSTEWTEEIDRLKSGEYTERFVHLKEISEMEYMKATLRA